MYNYKVYSGIRNSTYYGFRPLLHEDLTEMKADTCVAIAWIPDEQSTELWIVQVDYIHELRRFYSDTCSTRVNIDVLEKDNILCPAQKY